MIRQRLNTMNPLPYFGGHSLQLIGGLHGVRYMQFSPCGNVYWKGIYLKNLDVPVDPSYYDEIQELGLVCRHLESINVPVNAQTAVCYASWFSDMCSDNPYKEVLSRCPKIHIGSDKLLLVFKRSAFEVSGEEVSCYHLPEINTPERAMCFETSDLERRGYTTWPMTNLGAGDLQLLLAHYFVPSNLFAFMAERLHPRKGEK